ncbi:hypothetical protein RI367_002514 [Sorochytrium milnesiophthora]
MIKDTVQSVITQSLLAGIQPVGGVVGDGGKIPDAVLLWLAAEFGLDAYPALECLDTHSFLNISIDSGGGRSGLVILSTAPPLESGSHHHHHQGRDEQAAEIARQTLHAYIHPDASTATATTFCYADGSYCSCESFSVTLMRQHTGTKTTGSAIGCPHVLACMLALHLQQVVYRRVSAKLYAECVHDYLMV